MNSLRQARRLCTSLLSRGSALELPRSVGSLASGSLPGWSAGRQRGIVGGTSQLVRALSDSSPAPVPKKKFVTVVFVDRDGEEHSVQAKVGDTLLEVAKHYDIDVEGACEGTLACSTCHLVVDQEWYDKIPDPLTDEEQDMLDLAFGLTDTSRLGCQILVSPDIDNIRLKVPEATKDIRNL